MNNEIPYVQDGFRKDRGFRDQISNFHWIIKNAREFQKNIYFCFFEDPANVCNSISGSSAFSKTSLYIWKFTVHILLNLALRILSISLLACEIFSSLNILWHCLSLVLEIKLTFSSPVATAEFSRFAVILSLALSQHHLLGFEIP